MMITIREALPHEDQILAEHFRKLWRDNQVPEELIEPDWAEITSRFITQARTHLQYRAFLALKDDDVVGSTSCQLFSGLAPLILTADYRQYGYIWGVYVEPAQRQQGLGQQLTQAATDYLRSIGCTQAILHASPMGRPVYTKLGFIESNEMRFDLTS